MGGRGASFGGGGGSGGGLAGNGYARYKSGDLLMEFGKLQKQKNRSRLHGVTWTTADNKQRKIAEVLESRESRPGHGRYSKRMREIDAIQGTR